MLQNKNNMFSYALVNMQRFYKTVLHIYLNIFVPNVFNKRNHPEIKTNIFFLTFNYTKESASSKNVARLLNKTVTKKEKRAKI